MRKSMIAAAATSLTASLTLMSAPALAVDPVNTQRLRQAVTVNGILSHERALQRIANESGGTRASSTPGYARSAAYVKQRLAAAGYRVSEQSFTFPFFRDVAPPTLAQVSPTPLTYSTATFEYSGSGTVTGRVVPTTDIVIPPSETAASTSGCEVSDFVPASASAPEVALVQRGTCNFEVKAANAQAAGYDAVVIFNEGQEGRQELLLGSLSRIFTVPVLGLSYADGRTLYAASEAGPVTVRATAATQSNPAARTTNVIAESRGGDPSKVLVVGAHLDSVIEGPGINDNGSGTSTVLEVALQMSGLKITPRQKVRFAFWGAEESGLRGSRHYVESLSSAALSQIYANLNFDMLGSKNYARFVYDGDGSASEAGPPGSGQIERIFTRYFASRGLASEPTAFNGRSDYGPFIAVGIPAGGLFSGAEGIKTAAQVRRYGGTAGAPFDPCYHLACDTTNNLSSKALLELGDAAAHAVLTLAMTKTGLFEDRSLRTAARAGMTKQFDYLGPQAIR